MRGIAVVGTECHLDLSELRAVADAVAVTRVGRRERGVRRRRLVGSVRGTLVVVVVAVVRTVLVGAIDEPASPCSASWPPPPPHALSVASSAMPNATTPTPLRPRCTPSAYGPSGR